MTDLRQYAELYASEAREHLGEINRGLLAFEADPGDRSVVESVFRAVHSLKGMSAAMGFQAVADLTHAMETALEELRKPEAAPSLEIVDRLLRAADVLEEAVEAAVGGTEMPPVGEWVARLQGSAAEVAQVWQVNVRLMPTVTLRAARAFVILQRAAQIGQVFDHVPPLEEIRAGRVEFELAFKIRTAQDASDVESHLAASGEVERADVAPPAETGVGADEPAADAERVPTARSAGVRVRVDIRRLDALMNLVGELVLVREELREWSQWHRSPGFDDLVDRANRLVGDLQREVLQSRMVPVWQVFDRFPRVVRDTARGLGKEVELIVEGKEIELDRSMLDEIGDPLIHLLRNAVDHGVELPEERVRAGKSRAGRVRLAARRERDTVILEISDDGRGIGRAALVAKGQELGLLSKDAPASLDDQEMWRLMAHSGLTTAVAVTGVSGRGVGLNVVEDRIRGLGGTVSMESREGVGTIFRLVLPLTLAIVRALVVRSHGARYAIPITHARETARSDERAVERADGREWLRWRDELVPFTRLGHVLGGDGAAPGSFPVVALEIGGRRLALAVDELVGEQEIVVKAFHSPQGTLSIFSGATVMPDGRPVLIVDVASLA